MKIVEMVVLLASKFSGMGHVWQGIKGLFIRRPIITSGTYKVTGVEDASITITKDGGY